MEHKLLPLVVSFSDFANFKRCRKLFDLSFVRGLSPLGDTKEVMQTGTDIHKLLECAVTGETPPPLSAEVHGVVDAYLQAHPLPEGIISAEGPIYTLVLEETASTPALYIRTTLDLIYTRGTNTVVGKDYKSFQNAPSFDVDVDYQGRIYTVMLARRYPKNEVEFEWQYIRQVLGRELKGKGYVAWTAEERYINIPMVMSTIEMETTWRELQWTALDLMRALAEERFYRVELKSGPHSCDNCNYKAPCVAEYSHGALSQMDLDLLTKPTVHAERMNAQGILDDPRVAYHMRGLDFSHVKALYTCVERVYGPKGVEVVREAQQQKGLSLA